MKSLNKIITFVLLMCLVVSSAGCACNGKNGAQYTVKFFSADEKAGTVSANIKDDKAVESDGKVGADTIIIFNAAPNDGYRFDGWYSGIAQISTSAKMTVVIKSDVEYEARFVKKGYNPGGGTTAEPGGEDIELSPEIDETGHIIEKDEDPSSSGLTSFTEMGEYSGGIHEYGVTKKSSYIFSNNTSQYKIIIPSQCDNIIREAANEFSELFGEATGYTFEVLEDDEISAGDKYISLGSTLYAEENNVAIDSRLNSQGFVIKTVGDNIYVVGGNYGVLWGVYELLSQLVGYEFIAYDTWIFAEDTGSVNLYDFNIVDNPDFEIRLANYGINYTDAAMAHRYRELRPHTEVYLAGDKPYHNYFTFIPKEKHLEAHPEWYSTDGTQLCLTARGDPDEYEALLKEMVNVVKAEIDKDANKKIITITQEDVNAWCKCDTCLANYNKYGTNAATSIMFINDVADRVKAWLDKERGGREVIISLFAYQATEQAPAVKDKDGKYVAIDEKVVCRDNVAVLYAPIYASLTNGFEQENNKNTLEIIKAWAACCKKFGYWGYTTNFTNYLIPYNSFSAAQSIYKCLLENFEPIWIFDQGQYDNSNSTGFTHFKMYLQKEWMWDVNADYYEMKDIFFKEYFLDASDIMVKLYDEVTAHLYYLQSEMNAGAGIFEVLDEQKYWPVQLLKQWVRYGKQALLAAEAMRGKENISDADVDKTLDHIRLETISYRYLLLNLYSGSLSQSEYDNMVRELKKDVADLGVTNLKENSSINSVLENL